VLHVLRSDVLRGLHRAREAQDAAEEAVRLDPDDPDGHAAVALSAGARGEHDEAVAALQRALALAPDSGHLHRLLADQYLAQTSYDLAIAEYHRALSFDPNDSIVLNNLGCALSRRGRDEEAALAFKSAVMLDPTLKVAKQNAHETLGTIAKGASVLGVLALVGAKFKLFWLLIPLRHLLFVPWAWVGLGILVVLAVGVAKLRGQRRLRRLARKDPQLLALYERLAADKKAGRI
jgi:tetratricopeptide (TPR) repeat protein